MPIAIRSDKIDLSTEKQTEELADRFLKKIEPGNIIFLYGEIGVGKTTFIKYLINGFQKINKLETSEVTSPTFNLLNEYQFHKIKINHYDLFRVKSKDELKDLILFENNNSSITLVVFEPSAMYSSWEARGKVIEIIEDESANQHIDKLSRRYTSHPYAREDDVSWDEAGIKDRELWVIEVSKLNSMIRPQAKSDPE